MFSKIRNIILFLIVAGGVFFVGFYAGKDSVFCEVCPPQDVNFSLFWEAWNNLKENFVDPSKFDTQKMIYGAISGMVNSLEDPYTVFFTPEDNQKFKEDVSGKFEGIGAEIGKRNGQIQIVAPLEGTPAKMAGLRAGDKIIKINDVLTDDIPVEKAVSLIRGKRGTEVVLTIMRDNFDAPKEIKIIRGVIEIPSLKLEFKEYGIVYIKIYQFSEKAYNDFSRAALDIIDSDAKKIILDLRDNPGGYLEVAQDIAGWFLEKGKIVVIEDFGSGLEKSEYKSTGNAMLSDYKIIVLINKGSASAAEILAAALKDNLGVQFVGETSFGKGSVQQLQELSNESALKITIARWLTPNGELIQDKGLKADVEIEMTDEDYKQEKDPQLDKAIEIIKDL